MQTMLPMCAVSVCQSVCHAAKVGFAVWGSFGAAFAKSLWPLVYTETNKRNITSLLYIHSDGAYRWPAYGTK